MRSVWGSIAVTLRQRIEREAARARPDKALRDLLLLPFVAVALIGGLVFRGAWVVACFIYGSLKTGWLIAWGKNPYDL